MLFNRIFICSYQQKSHVLVSVSVEPPKFVYVGIYVDV